MSLLDLVSSIKMAVCAEAERKKECVGDRDAGESWRWGGYGVEMSCSDVTSAVSRPDSAMCHTDRGVGAGG